VGEVFWMALNISFSSKIIQCLHYHTYLAFVPSSITSSNQPKIKMRLTFLSFSFSLLVGTTLAADCGGSQHLSHAVFDSYDKYHQACDVAMSSTNGGYGFHEQDSLNIKMQVQLSASHVNNGYAGMQNIVDQCFRNGWNGEVWS
jgi:hypothetical protein